MNRMPLGCLGSRKWAQLLLGNGAPLSLSLIVRLTIAGEEGGIIIRCR